MGGKLRGLSAESKQGRPPICIGDRNPDQGYRANEQALHDLLQKRGLARSIQADENCLSRTLYKRRLITGLHPVAIAMPGWKPGRLRARSIRSREAISVLSERNLRDGATTKSLPGIDVQGRHVQSPCSYVQHHFQSEAHSKNCRRCPVELNPLRVQVLYSNH